MEMGGRYEDILLGPPIAGFRLGIGIDGEIELYCFEDEAGEQVRKGAGASCPQTKI